MYENEFGGNAIENKFIEQGELKTLWMIETEYKFKTLLMRILGLAMKRNLIRRTYRDMERFKELAESLSSSK